MGDATNGSAGREGKPESDVQAASDELDQAEPLLKPESGGEDLSSNLIEPEGDASVGEDVSVAPASPAYEASASQNAGGTYTVSLSVRGTYLSRTVFGKTTLDYTKGAGITCSLSKWVHGTGVHGEPAGFTYTKTDASGLVSAWDDAIPAMVYEDGTLVWGVGSLDPHSSAAMEPDVTYTISFEVAARDVAYADFASSDPEVPDHNYPVFALATLQYLQMQEKTGSVPMGFDGLVDYNQVYVPVAQGPSAPSVGGDGDPGNTGEPGGTDETDQPAQPDQPDDAVQPEAPVGVPAANEVVNPVPQNAAPASVRSELPKTADFSACAPLLTVLALMGAALVGAAGMLVGQVKRSA